MTEYKERPIIFSGEMVRAIMRGRKTQTRRVITQCATDDYFINQGNGRAIFGSRILDIALEETGTPRLSVRAPYNAGNRLYVREAWQTCPECGRPNWRAGCNGQPDDPICQHCDAGLSSKWKPSIHMWKDYARIWLEVIGVRVERVQDITQEDVIAEGVWREHGKHSVGWLDEFRFLWDKINKKRGYGWDVNPWVWVVDFEVVSDDDLVTVYKDGLWEKAHEKGSRSGKSGDENSPDG